MVFSLHNTDAYLEVKSKIVTGQQTIIHKVHGKLLVKKIYVVNQSEIQSFLDNEEHLKKIMDAQIYFQQ